MVTDTGLGRQLENVPDVNPSDGIGILKGDDLGCVEIDCETTGGWNWGYDGVEETAGITRFAVV